MELGAIGPAVVLFSLISAVQSQFECPVPWLQFEDKCYKFELFEDSLQNAEEVCARDGASLVSVNHLDEHNFIVDILNTKDKDYKQWFTSGRREPLDPAKFFWSGDGQIIEGFQNWQDDQDRFIEGHDIIVYAYNGEDWKWVVIKSDEVHRYICEISRADVYRIIEEVRGFDYGSPETIATFLPHGPMFDKNGQPVNVIYDISSAEDFVSLECRADAIPPPGYEWFIRRDQKRQAINPLQDTRYTLINGKLIIHEPRDTVDNGDYQCVASNTYGSVLSNSVTLSFGFLLDFPKSSRDPVSVAEYAGVGIECNPPEHYPALSYSWYKDDIRNFIRPNLKPYTFISHNGKLYFSSVTKDDEGDYYCMVTTTNDAVTSYQGTISTGIPLIVKEAIASIREPQIASGFPTVFPSSPLQGDTVRVECFAWGTDNLGYTWERVGKPMPPNYETEDYGRVLKIPNIEIIHGGDYRCTVTRENGQSSSGIIRVPVDALPYFTIPLEAQHMDKGADLTWRCIANGVPSVQYKWYRNATAIEDDTSIRPEDLARIKIQNNVLTITDVQEKDSAMYQCAATNLHGTRYSSAQLRVLSFAPTFRKYPLQPHTYATLNGNVTLICRPEAAPAAEKEWLKNGRAFIPSINDGQQILPNGNLVLRKVKNRDAGEYTCKAKNEHGEAESTTELLVLTTTVVSYAPQDETVLVNKTTFLPCEASFNPQLDLTYTWYQNDFLIHFERIRTIGMKVYIERDPYFHRGTGVNTGGLVIYPTQFWHAGEYKCVVQSSSDKVEKTATLRVIGPPGPPAGVFGNGVTASSIILTWKKGAENGRSILGYIVEGFNEHEQIWSELKTNIRGRDLLDQRTNITRLSPWSQYKFRIRAENSLGVGEPSAESESYTTAPAPPYKYPLQVGGGGGKVGDLVMTWEPLPPRDQNGEGIGYIVYWKKKYLIDEEWSSQKLYGADQNRYVHTVTEDNFYKQYDVRVQAFNKVGRGPESPFVTIMSAEDLPDGVPTNVRAYQYNSTALLVEWTPVPDTRESIKGVLLGYRVNYWKFESEDETMSIYNSIRGQTDRGFIIGLDPKTYYYVNVQVYNSAGNGPKSEDFLEETLRSAPKEAPTEVHVNVLGPDSIEVDWRGVSTDQSEEPLQGYQVEYWRAGESIYVARTQDSGKKTHMEVENLDQGVLYNLRIRGYSRGGDGLASSPTIQFMLGADCRVLEESPDKRFVYACKGCMIHISSMLLLVLIIFHVIKSAL